MEDLDREKKRQLVLKEYNILDTLPENELNELTRMAALICNVQFAHIALVDKNRVWIKSSSGLGVSEIPRELSFCHYAIQGTGIYEIQDASQIKEFARNPFVTGFPHIRFYAGVPLISPEGFTLGTLSVLDASVRQLDEKQRETLELLSRLIMQQLELRRKKAEIENTSMVFHKIVEEVADIIYTTTPDGYFTYINQKVETILGYKPYELVGKQYSEIILPEWREQVMNFYAEQFEQLKYETKTEFPVINKWGETRWVEQSVVAIITDSFVQGFQGIVRDVTERKKYEAELLETKSLLTQAMSIGRLGSFENNVVTQKVVWSKEIYDMMDMPTSEKPLSFEEYLKTIHPDDLQGVLDRIARNRQTKQPDMYVCRYITAAGRIKWMETRVVPFFDLDDNLVVVRGTMQDITKQKELELQLIASKEMAEQSMIAKEQFLANMSHEIRTPMNAVLGFADLLAESALNKEQKEFVSAIQTSGKNLMTIINDILDYSKIEAGMMSIEESPLSIRSIFSSLGVLFGQKAREKNLALSFTSDPAIPETLLGDSTRLTQIITNLVGNALKFTAKGRIEVYARLVENSDKKTVVLFSVQDTGIGIDKDKLAAVFERFNQGSNSTTRQYGGTGLGLSIARKLVELQGGTISVSSEKGIGSTFAFSIVFKPCEQAVHHEPVPHAVSAEKHVTGPVKILLAEDNLMNQKLAQRILNNLGYEVEIAENGKIAVDKVEHNQYDLVLMDVQMPDMDGYEAATIIRKKLHQDVPIIAMTAHALSGEKEKCLDLGMNDYIAKPFKPDHLQAKIEALVLHNPDKKFSINLVDVYRISGGDDRFVREVIKVFVADTPVMLQQLTEAVETGNYTTVRNMAHKLVSSVGLVGLKDILLPVLQKMEMLGMKQNDLPRIRVLNEYFQVACKQAIAEAREYLD